GEHLAVVGVRRSAERGLGGERPVLRRAPQVPGAQLAVRARPEELAAGGAERRRPTEPPPFLLLKQPLAGGGAEHLQFLPLPPGPRRASRLPSGLKTAEVGEKDSHLRVCTTFPSRASSSSTPDGGTAAASSAPSGLNARLPIFPRLTENDRSGSFRAVSWTTT